MDETRLTPELEALRRFRRPKGLPFNIRKIGHVVLRSANLERSVDFYTQVMGFEISDIYPETMVPGCMVFMRCNTDHHGVALVGARKGENPHEELHHMAFEVPYLDDVFRARAHLRKHGVPIDFEGRRRAGVQIAVEFRDPDDHRLEIYWGLDQVGSDGRTRPKSEWDQRLTLEEAVRNPVPGQDATLVDPSLMRD